MSRPDSTMVVATSTSYLPSQKSTMIASSWCSFIWPCATATRASGTSSATRAATLQLAADGGADLPLVVGSDERQHRMPLLRRGEDGGHLPDPGHAHLQRPRDRRGRHRQHVDLGPQPLQVLLVLDPEALLLVDDDQAQLGEPDLRRQQLVGADDHVDLAVGQLPQRLR